MIRFALLALVLSPLAAAGAAPDAEKQKLRAKAALALAATKAPAAPSAIPAPREVGEFAPVVVYVGQVPCPTLRGAFQLTAKDYPGVASPAVVVQYPVGDRMVTEATFKGTPATADVQKAVNAAAKKADAKPMPPKAGKAACPCGDGCKCENCPADCPADSPAPKAKAGADPNQPAPAGWQWQRSGNEPWKLVKVEAKGVSQTAAPFAPGYTSTPTTPAIGAAATSTPSSGFYLPGNTYTFAPAGIPGATRNCASGA